MSRIPAASRATTISMPEGACGRGAPAASKLSSPRAPCLLDRGDAGRDRSFVIGVPGDHGSVAIMRAVAVMPESLGIRLIAERIERQEHIWLLKLLGCHEGQGYLFSEPIPERNFLQLQWVQRREAQALRTG
jgi:predicted signal transduction protein with EAL and GGDEF domain